jgi:hypothetical protein
MKSLLSILKKSISTFMVLFLIFSFGNCDSISAQTEPPETIIPPFSTKQTNLPGPDSETKRSGVEFSTKWDLWSDGITHLRGANIWQSLVVPEVDGDFKGTERVGPPYQQKDFDQLAEWGANYIVLSVPGIFTENPPYEIDQKVQENLDRLLDMAVKADLFVTIAFRTGPGRAEWSLCCSGEKEYKEYFNDKVWTDAKAQQAWTEMWKATAERYRNHPEVVGYELMVEPDAEDILLNIWNPEDFFPKYANTLYDWNQFYPKIVKAIRQVDQDTPIIVGSSGYSSIRWLPYLISIEEYKIVYDVHQYEPFSAYTHQESGSRHGYPGNYDIDNDGIKDAFNKEWLRGQYAIVQQYANEHKAAMAVNEFGVKRFVPDAAKFTSDQIEIIESFGWNYAVWEWSSTFKPFSDTVTDFNFRLGPNIKNNKPVPNALADVIKNYWQRNVIHLSNIKWSK